MSSNQQKISNLPDPVGMGALKEILVHSIRSSEPVLVVGSPGIGKTDAVAQAVSHLNNDDKEPDYDLMITHPVVDEPIDYKGLPTVVDDEAQFLPFGNLNAMIEAERPLVVFMDDLGQAPAAVQAALMQLLLSRSINGKPISEHVRFVAATNKKSDRAGVSGILEPVKSRFSTIVYLEARTKEWLGWAARSGIRPEILAFMDFKPDALHKFVPTAEISNSPSPRMWSKLSRMIDADFSEEALIACINGAIGSAYGGEFYSFLRVAQKLPNPDLMIKNPTEAKIPTEPDILHALIGALAARVTKKNWNNIITLGTRMPKEFIIVLVRACLRTDPSLRDTKGFERFAESIEGVFGI